MWRLLLASSSSCSFPIIGHIVKTPFHIKIILYVAGTFSMLYHYNCEIDELLKINNNAKKKNNKLLYFECLDGIAINILCNEFFWKGNHYILPIQILTTSSYIFTKLYFKSEIIKNITYTLATQRLFWKYPSNRIYFLLSLLGYFDFRLNNCVWKMPSRYIWHIGTASFIGSCMRHFYTT